MAHQQQKDFCIEVKNKFPEHFINKTVLDIGCYDINGNNRYLFDNCSYLGADIGYGPNVDFVSKAHEISFRNEYFDTIVTTEMLEHDVFYYLSLQNIARMLKSNGMLIFTCATVGRPEHGTLRTSPTDSPFTSNVPLWANYYKNLTENDIRACLDINNIFSQYSFSIGDITHDLYFWGIKK